MAGCGLNRFVAIMSLGGDLGQAEGTTGVETRERE